MEFRDPRPGFVFNDDRMDGLIARNDPIDFFDLDDDGDFEDFFVENFFLDPDLEDLPLEDGFFADLDGPVLGLYTFRLPPLYLACFDRLFLGAASFGGRSLPAFDWGLRLGFGLLRRLGSISFLD